MNKRMTPYRAALAYAVTDVLRALIEKNHIVFEEYLPQIKKAARLLLRENQNKYMVKGKRFAAAWNKGEERSR